MMSQDQYKATHIVHWPSGPVDACAEHARQLVTLSNFLGGHVICTPAKPGAVCVNCLNEAQPKGSA